MQERRYCRNRLKMDATRHDRQTTCQHACQKKPYAAAVHQHFWDGKCCFHCLKATKTRRCVGCEEAWYCSEECQKLDWQRGLHSKECDIFKKVKSKLVWSELKQDVALRAVMRAIARKAVDSGHGDATDVEGPFPGDIPRRRLDDLLARKTVLKGVGMTTYEASKALFFKTYARESPFFSKIDEKDLLRIFALFSTNGLAVEECRVFDYRTVERGAALYLQLSLFNHSCDPDLVFFTGDTAQMTIKTLKNIQEKNFEELTISYCQFHPPAVCTTAEFRKPLLKKRFSFNCRCVLCRDKKADLFKMHGVNISCSRCGEPMIIKKEQRDIPERRNRAKCLNCKQYYKIPHNQFLATIQFWELYHKDSPENFPMAALPRIAEILHPLKAQKLMELRFMSGNLLEGEKILEMYEHYGVKAPSYPVLCAQLGRIYEKAEEFEKAKECYERALNLWSDMYTPQYRCARTLNYIIRKRLPETELATKKRIAEEEERERLIREIEEREREDDEQLEESEDENNIVDGALIDARAEPSLPNYLPGTEEKDRPSDSESDSDSEFKRRPFQLQKPIAPPTPFGAFHGSSSSLSDSGSNSDTDKSSSTEKPPVTKRRPTKPNRLYKRKAKGQKQKIKEETVETTEDVELRRRMAEERLQAVKEGQNKTFEWPTLEEESDVSV